METKATIKNQMQGIFDPENIIILIPEGYKTNEGDPRPIQEGKLRYYKGNLDYLSSIGSLLDEPIEALKDPFILYKDTDYYWETLYCFNILIQMLWAQINNGNFREARELRDFLWETYHSLSDSMDYIYPGDRLFDIYQDLDDNPELVYKRVIGLYQID